MIRPNSYSIIINQPVVLAQRCCVRQRTPVQTRCVAFLSGSNNRRKGLALQRHQQQRKITSGGDANVKTALGGTGAGTGAGAGVGAASTGDVGQQTRPQTTHAISNPVLADIEKRWDDMPPQEQANLWMSLRDRLKVDWHDLTLNEKKAGMFIICCLDSHGTFAIHIYSTFILFLRGILKCT